MHTLEFVEQTRLPQPRLAHHADNLPVAGFGLRQRLLHLLQFALPSDKARQPTRAATCSRVRGARPRALHRQGAVPPLL